MPGAALTPVTVSTTVVAPARRKQKFVNPGSAWVLGVDPLGGFVLGPEPLPPEPGNPLGFLVVPTPDVLSLGSDPLGMLVLPEPTRGAVEDDTPRTIVASLEEGGGPQVVAVPTIVESDTYYQLSTVELGTIEVRPITGVRRKAVTAVVLPNVAVAIEPPYPHAKEVDAAVALGRRKRMAVTPVLSPNAAVTLVKVRAMATRTEATSALAPGRRKRKDVTPIDTTRRLP